MIRDLIDRTPGAVSFSRAVRRVVSASAPFIGELGGLGGSGFWGDGVDAAIGGLAVGVLGAGAGAGAVPGADAGAAAADAGDGPLRFPSSAHFAQGTWRQLIARRAVTASVKIG